MKRFLSLVPLIAAATLTSATSLASEPTETAATEAIVQKELIKPLATKERHRSRFSRSRLPAQARRVRVLDTQPQKDEAGATFVKFAVDARHGFDIEDEPTGVEGWRKDTITGCVYPDSGEVFVLRGAAYHPAAIMVGKKTKPAAKHTCQNDAMQVASAT